MVRRNGSFLGHDGLDAPDAPTGVAGTASSEEVSVAFTAGTAGTTATTGFVVQVSTNGTDYSAGSNTGGSSPIVVSSLTNFTTATAKVWAINAHGTSEPSEASSSFTPVAPRAYWFGRTTVNVFYSSITSTGNTTDWGYAMRYANYTCGTGSSTTRAVQCGYEDDASAASSQLIEQFNLASGGTGTNFGDLNVTAAKRNAGCSNDTRAIFTQGASNSNVIEFVTIASAGDGTDFGNLTAGRSVNSALASPTRGVIVGGFVSGSNFSNIMDYVTISSTGNATDFGNTLAAVNGTASCSSSVRGVIGGGDVSGGTQNVIQYITIASAGNATDFGDLPHVIRYGGAGGSETRALFAGEFSGNTNGINYITIANTGNAQDFGDLTNNETNGVSCASNAHGGL